MRLSLTALTLLLIACPAGAHVRITTDLNFSDDVRPILRRHCMGCHSPGGSAPSYVDLTTYGTDSAPGARAWAAAIEEEVLTGRMPPWQADPRFDHFANTRRMSQEDIEILVGWIQGGGPQGPRRNLPPPPEFEEGAWQLGEPDLVVGSKEPFLLQAGRIEDEVSHTLEIEIEEDTWVTGFEFRAGTPGAVYRMAAWIHPPAGSVPESFEVEIQEPYDPFRDEDAPEPTRAYQLPPGPYFLGQWLRGDAPVLLPDGMGRRLRRGSTLELEVQYRRREMDGFDTEIRDQSKLGLFLAQEPDEVDLIVLAQSASAEVARPAARKRRKKKSAPPPTREALLTFAEDVRVVSLAPNLPPGVEQVEITLSYPDGRSDLLLLIEEYDPAWPSTFVLDRPLQAPPGSRLAMTGTLGVADNRPERPFELHAIYAVNDHLVLPEPVQAPRPAPSQGGMLGGGEGASSGVVDPQATAHMDHSPLHGGQFFMAMNNYHHLEGALPAQGEFRLYVYDDFKKPVDPRNFASEAIFESWNEEKKQWEETVYPMVYGGPGSAYLEAKIPAELPSEFYASVSLAGEKRRFDFYFEELSADLSAAELARYAALGSHSHERPPLQIPASAEEIVAELVTRTDVLRELMDSEEWLALHIPAFDARDLAEALLDHLGALSARERGKVSQAVSRAMQSAAALDRAGDLADPGRARNAFTRYERAMKTIFEAVYG